MRILGIDPGSRITGYGVIDVSGLQAQHVASGCIHTEEVALAQRLKTIYQGIATVIAAYQPLEVAAEQVFMHRNADSALKLGQARGAALAAVVMADLPVSEYAPRSVKQALVGKGAADKVQVQYMVTLLLQLATTPAADAADALAVALCHAHTRRSVQRGLPALRRGRR